MLWRDQRASANIEDRRGGGMVAGGGIGMLVLAAIVYFMGGDPTPVLREAATPRQTQGSGPIEQSPEEAEQVEFVSRVLSSTEDVWTKVLQAEGIRYQEPKLVLFRDGVQSACGTASSEVGPFYCPADRKAYLDLGFFDQLSGQLGATGEFARAYVIAHEIGHHVQNLLGTMDKVQSEGRTSGEGSSAVRLELQADYYAGLWAHHTQGTDIKLNQKDLEAGLNAASAIGDDTLQKRGQGQVVPDAFTHGTSAQRVRWFRRGMELGTLEGGDTFAARDL